MDDEYERKVAELARALWIKNGWIGEIEDYRLEARRRLCAGGDEDARAADA